MRRCRNCVPPAMPTWICRPLGDGQFAVGFYDWNGDWVAVSDHVSSESAQRTIGVLAGGEARDALLSLLTASERFVRRLKAGKPAVAATTAFAKVVKATRERFTPFNARVPT